LLLLVKVQANSLVELDLFSSFYFTSDNNEKLKEVTEKAEELLRDYRKNKANFIQILCKYNYYHKDLQLEELIAVFSNIKIFTQDGVYEKIKDDAIFIKRRKEEENRINSGFNRSIDDITKYLNKK
jgi:hypothetical protein